MNKNVTNFQRYELGNRVLKEHGFCMLTGEACGYSMRILFDIDDNAKRILSGYFGSAVEFNNGAWNGRDGAKNSVMLPRDMIESLAIYILLSECEYTHVIVCSTESAKDAGIHPFVRAYHNYDDYSEDISQLRKFGYDWRLYSGETARNRHAFSGRVE